MAEAFVRIYEKDEDGRLADTRETFEASDFANGLPRVGECIVSRWLRDKAEETRWWGNRSVYVVTDVYHLPHKRTAESDDSWTVLVVRTRPMKEAEQDLL